jgi:hypothetical protein
LKLFAGLAFSHYPAVQTVVTGFVWLQAGKMDTEKFTRADVPAIWMTFVPRVARMAEAYEKGNFPPNPTGLCGWCPVGKLKCSFWKGYSGERR